jgi:hypothetical protein
MQTTRRPRTRGGVRGSSSGERRTAEDAARGVASHGARSATPEGGDNPGSATGAEISAPVSAVQRGR